MIYVIQSTDLLTHSATPLGGAHVNVGLLTVACQDAQDAERVGRAFLERAALMRENRGLPEVVPGTEPPLPQGICLEPHRHLADCYEVLLDDERIGWVQREASGWVPMDVEGGRWLNGQESTRHAAVLAVMGGHDG